MQAKCASCHVSTENPQFMRPNPTLREGVMTFNMGGLVSLQGYEGEGPHKSGISYGDPTGGLHGAFTVLAAAVAAVLWRRPPRRRQRIVSEERVAAAMISGGRTASTMGRRSERCSRPSTAGMVSRSDAART